MATSVKLRQRAISGNRQSLYLDFYPPITNPQTGKQTRREYLGLYLFDSPKTPIDKLSNKETKQLAENIRAKRQIEIQANDFGFINSKDKGNTDFIQFFKQLSDTKTGNKKIWQTSLKHFKAFAGGTLPVSELNENICNNFKEYLLTVKKRRGYQGEPIAQNSALCYYIIFKAALRQAYKKGIIQKDLNEFIEGINKTEVQRQHLTIEEVQRLANTTCEVPKIKNASLFSCLTGLRISDILKLVWGEVQQSQSEGYFLQFRQQKTKSVEVLPISEQAFFLLGERKEPTEKVFEGLKYTSHMNAKLKFWVLQAGITKDITFHSFRHTYATLQLSMGTDIYTVSKMLGHRELKTTQIYAKIIDQTKRDAVDKIKINL